MIRVLRETKQTPREIEERVTRAGGRNRYGEPNFRVVWGWSRLTWIGGKWEDRDDSGNLVRAVVELRQVPKYFPHDRWHIERWFPPEQYGSPDQWYAQTIEAEGGRSLPALGPYPARGDWEHCVTLERPGGGFLALTANVCDYVIRAVEWAKAQPASAQLAALERREDQRERDWHRHAEQVLWGDARAFCGQPFITVPRSL
jgi:hypothetical protein